MTKREADERCKEGEKSLKIFLEKGKCYSGRIQEVGKYKSFEVGKRDE